MKLRYDLNTPYNKMGELERELIPRGACQDFALQRGDFIATLVLKEDFDDHYIDSDFYPQAKMDSEEPEDSDDLTKHRQAWGNLKSGEGVIYCELSVEYDRKARDLFDSLRNSNGQK